MQSPITYLILLNFLGILLFIFLGFVTGEIILPGILSDYISLGKITGFLFLVIALIVILAKEQEIAFKKKKNKIFFTIIGYLALVFLTFISLYKFKLKLDLILTLISVILFFLFNKYFFEDLEK